jgi:hypothetical protein
VSTSGGGGGRTPRGALLPDSCLPESLSPDRSIRSTVLWDAGRLVVRQSRIVWRRHLRSASGIAAASDACLPWWKWQKPGLNASRAPNIGWTAANNVMMMALAITREIPAMVKITIFGGYEGRLNFDNEFYFTLFGGCELVRPTLARQLVAQRQIERDTSSPQKGLDWRREAGGAPGRYPNRRRPFFFTMFGSTEIKASTLAEEFIDLREAISSGALTVEDWDRSLADLARPEGSIGSFTLFGGFEDDVTPKEDEEVDALAIQRHLGNVSEHAGQALQLGIGQREGERRAILRHALLAESQVT